MATTSTQLIAWLKSDTAKRCVLIRASVQVNGVETTRYLSNRNYGVYLPVIAGGVTFTEELALDGAVSISSGNIDFHNINGEIDTWLDDIWKNRKIQVLIGDEFWAEADFYTIFNGVVAEQPTANDRTKITLTLSDKLQRLNTTVSDVTLNNGTANTDKLIPLLFGECFNISPLLTNNATLEYQIHNGPIERIIEVRDNGIPIGFTASLSTGKFTLTQQPVGTITCDAQGYNTGGYVNDCAGIIKALVKNYGDSDKRFIDSELSLPNTITDVIGVYMTEKTNLLDLCNQVASSVGARVAMTRSGILYIVRIQLPQPNTGTQVGAANIRERTLTAETVPVVASVKIGYCKNYTPQTSLETGLPADQIYLLAQDWPFTSTFSDDSVASKYMLIQNPDITQTCLQSKSDADSESSRQGALYGVERKLYTFEGTPELLLESLGGPIFIQHKRFGLSAGKAAQVTKIETDWLAAKPTLTVLA